MKTRGRGYLQASYDCMGLRRQRQDNNATIIEFERELEAFVGQLDAQLASVALKEMLQ